MSRVILILFRITLLHIIFNQPLLILLPLAVTKREILLSVLTILSRKIMRIKNNINQVIFIDLNTVTPRSD